MSKLPEAVMQVIRETRYLYRLSVTEDEVQDGWVRIILCEIDYPNFAEDLAATKREFGMRMDIMELQYINFDKAIAAINSRTSILKVGRVQDVNDNL